MDLIATASFMGRGDAHGTPENQVAGVDRAMRADVALAAARGRGPGIADPGGAVAAGAFGGAHRRALCDGTGSPFELRSSQGAKPRSGPGQDTSRRGW